MARPGCARTGAVGSYAHAILQHIGADRRGGPLPRAPAVAVRRGRAVAVDRAEAVLRAARAETDGQDHGPGRPSRTSERQSAVPLCLRQRRAGPDRAGRCRRGHAGDPEPHFTRGHIHVGRPHGVRCVAGCPGARRAAGCATQHPGAVGGLGSQAAGAADRRDRRADRRHPGLRAAATPHWLPRPPVAVSPERGAVWRA